MRMAIALSSLLLLTACSTTPCVKEDCSATRPLLINITSGVDDAHAVTMALQLAGHGVDDGRAVTLFFNVRGTAIASTKLDPTLAHGDKPIKTLLSDLMARGATVLVCPHCMKVMGVTEVDLPAGAQVASADSVFGAVDRGAAVFTY
jgi:predicted peroxiredoxin